MSEKKGTYYEIEQLSKRIDKLESTIREFMSKWGEMVRVVSIQNKNQGK